MNHASKSLLDSVLSSFKNSFKNAWSAGITSSKFGVKGTGKKVDTEGLPFDDSISKKALLAGLDFTAFRDYRGQTTLRSASIITNNANLNIENPYNFDSNAIAIMNKYSGDTLESASRSNVASSEGKLFGSSSPVKRSLFNPYNSVHVIGITENVPLLYDQQEKDYETPDREHNISDCSISRLVSLSAQKGSILGQARYKYADFAFCKDLGMPNNRLITLRRFSIPVGDNIFRAASDNNEYFTTPGDIGHMCCYFDTEDNKLEDILKYSFSSSFKNMEADLQQLASQENDRDNPLGNIINALNPSMNSNIDKGFEKAQNSLIGKAFNSFFGWETGEYYDKRLLFKESDPHRIYTPRNTIQSMEKYEGRLDFKHEFTLVFSYKLRGYQNINPKSAMLDLLANIFATTYNRGTFWGGKQEIIGAQPNKNGWKKANQLLEKGFDKIGGLFGALTNGTFDMGNLLSFISDAGKAIFNNGVEMVTKLIENPAEAGKNIMGLVKKFKVGDAATGLLKNQLGRPEIYAFQSLLDGSNTGLWHVTIGNPLNPIVSIGNLIVSNTEIQQFGPLGIDDFPTELKVTVSLKHARPRDSVAMERMYTKGVSAIYMPLTGRTEDVFRDKVKEEIGSLDYYGEFDTDRIQRNSDELS